MFKSLKKQAREILVHNYKFMLLPSFLFIVSNAVIYMVQNFFASFFMWEDFNDITRFLMMIIFLTTEFLLYPLSIVLMFKISIILDNENRENVIPTVKKFIKKSSIIKIVIINFIPRLITTFFDITNNRVSYFYNILNLDKSILIIIALLGIFINYKFYVCNYYFALNESTVKDAILISFRTMKRKFWKYLLLPFTFSLWLLLELGIYILLGLAINDIRSPFLGVLKSFGFGIGFYLIPYMYLTISLFIKSMLKGKTGGKTGDGSVSC